MYQMFINKINYKMRNKKQIFIIKPMPEKKFIKDR